MEYWVSEPDTRVNALRRKGAVAENYEGSCHCGRIAFRVQADLAEVLECNCSICTKKGFLHLIVEKARFQLLRGEQHMATYSFNTHVAKHIFCVTCGCHPYYIPRSDPDKIDVNARCLDGIDISSIAPHPFDGINWEQGMRNRARRSQT
jgi:hypothetical protein